MWYFIVALIIYPILYVLVKKKRFGLYYYAVLMWGKLDHKERHTIREKLSKSNYWDADEDFLGVPFALVIAIICLVWPVVPFAIVIVLLFNGFVRLLDIIIKEKKDF